MIDIGEFQRFNRGLCVFKCKTCKQYMEIKDLNLFINHVKENHSLQYFYQNQFDDNGKKQFDNQNPRLLKEKKPSDTNKQIKPSINSPKSELITKIKISLKQSEIIKVENLDCETINEFQFDQQLFKTILNGRKGKIYQNEIDLPNQIKIRDMKNRYQHSDFDNYLYNEEIEKSETVIRKLPKQNSDINSKPICSNKYDFNDVNKNVNETECTSNSKKSKKCILSQSPYIKIKNDNFHITDGSADKCQIFHKHQNICFTFEKCVTKHKKETAISKNVKICEQIKHNMKKKIKIVEQNENYMYQCTNCELDFTNVDKFKLHKKLHVLENIKQKIQCEICGKNLNSIASLKKHLLRHNGLSPYKCSICDKGISNKYALLAHQQTHNSEKKHKCEYCDKQYIRYVDLKRHVQNTHFKEKSNSVMCDLCGKSFSFAFNLKYHMRRHLNVKPIKCDKCDMNFVEKGDLNKHLITHNPDHKPFICEICSKCFSRKITLTKHQKLHTGLKEYICKICGKAFAQSPGLYMHMKTHGFNIKPVGAGYYERQSHLLFRNMNSDRANLI